MAELRWNPMIGDWVIIASHRQNRPLMPKDWCPFCPGDDNPKIPKTYDVLKYDNDFPALSQNPPPMDQPYPESAADLYKTAPAYGKCEVVLYSPDHHGKLCELPKAHVRKLVDLWTERFCGLSSDPKIKYVFIFENRGDVVGVTMPHPHGQIYAYSVMPKKMELECQSGQRFFEKTGHCMFCRMNEEESKFAQRVIYENEHFICFIPFFADYAYGTYIVSKAHKRDLSCFTDAERDSLADMIKSITGMYDSLFDRPFPYMMCMHNGVVNSDEEFPHSDDYSHFHIEYYPPMRGMDKQQFQASSETGVWAHCNPTAPEEKAEEMRAALKKFLARQENA